MKRVVGIILVCLLVPSLMWTAPAYSGEPYAPVYKFTKKDFDRGLGGMGMPMEDAEMAGMWPPVKAEDIPGRGSMEIPPYPGAVIVALNKPFMRDSQGKVMGLATMELLSTDPYEKIVSFYKEKLPGWSEKSYEYSHYFAESGEAESNPRVMEVPHVGVKSLDGILNHGKYTDMEPQAQTIVLVFFQKK